MYDKNDKSCEKCNNHAFGIIMGAEEIKTYFDPDIKNEDRYEGTSPDLNIERIRKDMAKLKRHVRYHK